MVLIKFKIMFESKLFTKFETNVDRGPNPASVLHTVLLWNCDFVCMRANLQVKLIKLMSFLRSQQKEIFKKGRRMKLDSSQHCPPFSSLNYPKIRHVTKTV